MKDQLEQRLKELKVEFESGQKMLAELEVKQANLRESLLRISGAIQVLEEELAKESKQESSDLGRSEVFPEPEPITE
jgi:predicted nuclease with TOPRIM domain